MNSCAFIAVFLCLTSSVSFAQKWTAMPGWARQISAKGDELWSVNDYDTPLRWENGKWVPKGHGVRHVAACGDYCAWARAAVDRTDGNVMRYNNASKKAQKFEPLGQFSGILDNVNAIAQDTAVGVNTDGILWRFWSDVNLWKHITRGNPVRGFQIAIGDEEEIWAVTYDNLLYRLKGNVWQKQPGNKRAKYVDVQGPGRVVVTDMDRKAHVLRKSGWKYLEGQECAQATINYESVFCVAPTGAIYKIDVPSEEQDKDKEEGGNEEDEMKENENGE